MKTILHIAIGASAILLVACASSFATQGIGADVLTVSITESKRPPTTTEFRIDRNSLHVSNTPASRKSSVPTIKEYSISNDNLCFAGTPLTQGDEILTQTTLDGEDFIVLRDQYNSMFGPINLLLFLGSHPVQVDRIAVVKVVSGKLIHRTELTSKESSYHWKATIYR